MASATVSWRGNTTTLAPGSSVVLGRDPDCGIVLPGPFVSREHARIESVGGCWWIERITSANPVRVNGNVIHHRLQLPSSATITVANVDVLFVTRPTPSPSPAASKPPQGISSSPHGTPPLKQPPKSAAPRGPLRRVLELPQGVSTLGRDQHNSVVLENINVSKRHATIRREGDTFYLKDLSSRNGTRVNGEFVAEATLARGAEVAIGPYVLVLSGPARARPPAPLIEARQLGFVVRERRGLRMRDKTILHPTSLAVRPGTFVLMIGPSGSGKSTLLKLLAGVLTPTCGSVTHSGDPLKVRRWDIGFVPQHDVLHGALSVEESLRYAARLRLPPDHSATELAARMEIVLGELELIEHRATRNSKLSGGQLKRVSVATELLGSPSVLLLDEPTSGLDPLRDERLTMVLEALARESRSVITVTHSTKWLHLCQHLVVMGEGGTLRYSGPPAGALTHFGETSYDAIFKQLGAVPPDGSAAPSGSRNRAPTQAGRRPGRATPSSFGEAGVLASRGLRLLARDRKNLMLLVLQAPLIAAAVALVFGARAFMPDGEITKSGQLLFVLVFVAAMFGTSLGAREIVRERAIFVRERALGVRSRSYLYSKCIVLGGVITFQTLALCAAAFAIAPLHASPTTYAWVVACVVLTGLTALAVGLMLSAAARSEAQATSALNLALIPQLLFAGAIVSLQDMGVLRPVAEVLPARWGYAGAGSALGLHDRAVDLHARAHPDASFTGFYGSEFFGLVPYAGPVVLAAMAVAVLIAVWARLSREAG